MTIPQLKMAMKVSQRALLDSSLSLALRGTIIVSIYRLYEEYKKKNIDSLPEICDLFECLALFYKDLDKHFKVIVEEFAILKTEFPNLKKTSRIRWMNDCEQKGAEIRDLLLADSAAPFVDLSRERTMP
jgi:hypothetical protein